MDEILKSALLGFIQGLTEFLPVSSSGHLAILHKVTGLETESNLFFDILLHLATLIAVVIFYRNTIKDIVRGGFFGIKNLIKGEGVKKSFFDSKDSRFFSLIIIGSIPTAIIGLTFKDAVEKLADNLFYVGIALLVTATLLILFELKRRAFKKIDQMSVLDSIIIGIVQGIAIIPGISRSGSTIATAKFLSIDKETAASYSFLLSLPAIGGAFLIGLKDVMGTEFSVEPFVLGVGFVTALTTGYFSLKLLVWMIKKSNMYFFAVYCVGIAIFAMTY
ncbi:MAG: undecaprenyl-diphosphate phosphatase [Candidatus Delongbacteria bacterium]|jgi:undecaprenyl-diphosphatase|nr:undecaprenyl-diphosphate phosphatase [Candidatus Delongbacteria bacterium]